ncbi:MAG: hypothetical protein Q7N87_02980 [Candidatus Uhrbacteria bacterium]|nr:hypothetical protein [Candidatus Uhrbacteria bacterium]
MTEFEALGDEEADVLADAEADHLLEGDLRATSLDVLPGVAAAEAVDDGENVERIDSLDQIQRIVAHSSVSFQASIYAGPKSVVPLTPGPEGCSSD